ncbi:hypothetical protein T440DRAFT_466988 [Plenodomus tracheiphilus IPT5]|uniref:Uncharacterized protein n=1 Tax=Plenodomus tracheiphilus IPT5 TaxID=1408161 RepID=A0A6A7B9W0_9PLEO|nr:hypothetical protein T440DRAFT_466988 [Plenodomus tracheiphilus IPT5]
MASKYFLFSSSHFLSSTLVYLLPSHTLLHMLSTAAIAATVSSQRAAMGRTTTPTPAYHDDPDAVSLHTTPDDYAYTDAPDLNDTTLPPSYADSEVSSAPAAFTTPIHHLPPPTTRTNHASPSFKNGHPVVCSTQTLLDPLLDNDPVLLEKTIRANAQTAPVQYIYIIGTHRETIKRGDKKETTDITDFRLVLNISPYLHPNFNADDISPMALVTVENSTKAFRGGITKTRAPGAKQDIEVGGAPKPSLTEWTHRYCASPRALRSFRLCREITGLNTTYLQQRIEGLIRATNYRGKIAITFPVEDANLDIYTATFINRWRLKAWVRWLFYLSFLWLVSWPLLFFATKRYAVVRAQWPYSVTDARGA